jgi:hypothetical protein
MNVKSPRTRPRISDRQATLDILQTGRWRTSLANQPHPDAGGAANRLLTPTAQGEDCTKSQQA